MNPVRMKYFAVLFLPMLVACDGTYYSKKRIPVQTLPISSLQKPAECNYALKKNNCKKLYGVFNKIHSEANLNELTTFIADSLFSCWYGTPWDFNGCTTTPQQGNIACGYFITTILQDAGIAINRIKMAQCASSELIKYACSGIKTYSNKTIKYFTDEIKKNGYGLYIAGLDFHTGFIYNDGLEVYFIHASYYGTKCVVKEKAIDCAVLRNSKLRMTGKVNFSK